MTAWSKPPSALAARPPVAVEIAPEGVLAAAAAPGHAPSFAWQPLPAGALAPSLADANLANSAAVADALRTALGKLDLRGKAVTLIVPDAAVRVFVLDFESLPARPAESLELVRFRLRKMVPFEVEHAGLSYRILSQSPTGCRALAAVMPAAVLQEYESAVVAAGFEPGVVLPATLAALAAADSLEARLSVHLSGQTLTTAIAHGSDLLLYRSLDLPEDEARQRDEIRRGVAVAAAFYEDHLHQPPTQLYFSGTTGARRFAQLLDSPELEITELTPAPATGALTPLGEACVAAVSGALSPAPALNLASRPFADHGPVLRNLRIAMAALAVAAIGLGAGLYSTHEQATATRNQQRALETRLVALQQEQSGYRKLMNRPENQLLLSQSATLNKLFDEKAFSWTLAMEDLERVLPAGVQLSTLEPVRDKEGHITLHLMVTGPRDRAVELVRNLERSSRFLAPRIVNESSDAGNRPGQALEPVSASSRSNFDLLAEYNPVSDEEAAALLSQQKKATESIPSKPSPAPAPRKLGGAR